MRDRSFQQPPPYTNEEVDEHIASGSGELFLVPLSVSLYSEDLEWATGVCVRLSLHDDPAVKGNAVLGFGHLARRFGRLDRAKVEHLVGRALTDPHAYVRGHAESAADDIEQFVGWRPVPG